MSNSEKETAVVTHEDAAAEQAAAPTLLDQRFFLLDREQWEKFRAALDAPPCPNERLTTLLARKPAWEG
jgi:uncharacterized protein (DUF1778 family)